MKLNIFFPLKKGHLLLVYKALSSWVAGKLKRLERVNERYPLDTLRSVESLNVWEPRPCHLCLLRGPSSTNRQGDTKRQMGPAGGGGDREALQSGLINVRSKPMDLFPTCKKIISFSVVGNSTEGLS